MEKIAHHFWYFLLGAPQASEGNPDSYQLSPKREILPKSYGTLGQRERERERERKREREKETQRVRESEMEKLSYLSNR